MIGFGAEGQAPLGKAPELFTEDERGARPWAPDQEKGAPLGSNGESPNHSTGLLAEAECAGVSEEGPSFVCGEGQLGPSKGLMSPLPPTGLTALFTVTPPDPPQEGLGFLGSTL